MKNILGYFLILIALILIVYVIFLSPSIQKKSSSFSVYTFLSSSWDKYKGQFLNKDGRIIQYSEGSITTSEAQSYAMLRSVWLGDKDTFDLVWKWTKENLKRPNDNLFGWRWGKKQNGSYGFENNDDMNSASDADSDIALSLILANKRWKNDSYLSSAKSILSDMWNLEVGTASGKHYVVAGNWANANNKLIVNPSYFSPYAYRVFSEVDKRHNWNSLISPGYDLLEKSGVAPLDKSKGVGLPPDWVGIDQSTGEIIKPDIQNLSTNYSYEAVRIPWRIQLDYQWNNSEEAKKYLSSSFNFLVDKYKSNKKIVSVYGHDGAELDLKESPTMYATSLSFLMFVNPTLAKDVYNKKILTLYSNDTNSFLDKLPYYEQNWLWFGAALYNDQLKKF